MIATPKGAWNAPARLAGFKDIEFFPEPVAAAFGYAGDAAGAGPDKKNALVLAADFGGGTSTSRYIAFPNGASPLPTSSRWAASRWPATRSMRR